MNILTDEQIREIELEFQEAMATWWDNATDGERMSLTNSPKDLTPRLLEAQVRETLKMVGEWGIEQCQEHYKGGGVISKRECPECWKSLNQSGSEK